MRRLRRLLRSQSGYSMVELLTVMVILGTIMGGLTTVFVQGSAAELHANRRVQAQLEATGAFDKLRRDVHCASSAAIADPDSDPTVGPTLTLSGCGSPTVDVRWCTVGSGTRFGLYRLAGTSYTKCDPSGNLDANYLIWSGQTSGTVSSLPGKFYADYLSPVGPWCQPDAPALFTYTAKVAGTSLAKVHVDVPVNVNPSKTVDTFELCDDIVLRNSTR